MLFVGLIIYNRVLLGYNILNKLLVNLRGGQGELPR